jgi:hypothetical protein
MTRILSVVPIALLLLGNGCRTSHSAVYDVFSLSSSKIQALTLEHHRNIHSLVCEGQVSVESKEISNSGSFSLALKKPDSVLITLRGPFGIKIGSALITRTHFFFYNSLQNKLISGPTSAEALDRTLHIQFSFDDLMNFFAGGSFMEEDRREPDQRSFEDESVLFKYRSSNTARTYWIDPETLSIQKIQHCDASGKLTREESFGKFSEHDEFNIPSTVRITDISSKRIFTVNYSLVQVNTSTVPFTFNVPENAERIRW